MADYLAWALNDRRVERRHLSGSQDRGDITGVMLDGERVCIEVKNTSRSDVSAHLAKRRPRQATMMRCSGRSCRNGMASASTAP